MTNMMFRSKSVVLLLVITLILAAVLPACKTPLAEYVNSDAGFALNYPPEWQEAPPDKTKGEVFVITSNEAYIRVKVFKEGERPPLDALEGWLRDIIATLYPGSEVISFTETTLADGVTPAAETYWKDPHEGKELTCLNFYAYIGNKVVVIKSYSPSQSWAENGPVIRDVNRSLRVLGEVAAITPTPTPTPTPALTPTPVVTPTACDYYHPTWQDRVELADKHPELPLNINIVDEWDGVGPQSAGTIGDCSYIDLWYNSTNGEQVPAYIVYPRNQGDGPFPIVVMGPGGGHGRDIQGLQHIAELFANNGLAAMVITFKYYRERDVHQNLYQACSDPQKRKEWMYQNFVDIRRALMVIDELDDTRNFDVAKAGYIGWSFGGLMGQCATAIEPLFKAQVFCVSGSRYAEILICGTRTCNEAEARADCGNIESLEWLEPKWFVSHLDGARPVLFIAGTQDDRQTPDEVREAYDLVTSTDKELYWYEGGHAYMPAEAYYYALNWLKGKLQ